MGRKKERKERQRKNGESLNLTPSPLQRIKSCCKEEEVIDVIS